MEADAIRLIALTGCRKGEICGLDWSVVRGRRLLLHDAKTGPRTVLLEKAAAELLERVPRHADLSSVFWIADKPLTVARMDGAYRRARLAAGLAHVRMHA
jgi:integrase